MNYRFNLILKGELTEEATNKLNQAGCSYMTFGIEAGVPYALVSLEAESLEEAKARAIAQINDSGSGIQVCDPLALPEKEEDGK